MRLARRHVLLSGLAVLVAGALALAALAPLDPSRPPATAAPASSTALGPERAIVVESLAIAFDPAGRPRLVTRAATNLVDGCVATLEVATAERLLSTSLTVRSGRLDGEAALAGLVTNGTYRATVTWKLEEQPPAAQRELRFQPRRVQTSSTFTVANALDPRAELRPRLRSIVERALVARDKAAFPELANAASAFERGLALSTLVPAARRLRELLEADPWKLEAKELERRLLAVDVLSSF